MKILHTSDWHLGKRLHQVDLVEDHQLFTNWLLQTIEKEKIDAVLISGDVFDLANPSSEARRLYYETLVKFSRMNCTVIITGGNHDSPAVLNAPREVLKALNVHVVGGLTENRQDMLIEVPGKHGDSQLVIAAIPFLRDADLRQSAPADSYEDKKEAIKEGITSIFNETAEICKANYSGIPAIAMGHLFATGVSTSESEREIQVGNLAQYEATNLSDYFTYIALGHIHKPQRAGGSERILYSGSPVPLSFSEKSDHKRVIVYELEPDKHSYRSIEVPSFRKLRKLTGNLSEVRNKLAKVDDAENPLPTLIEVEMTEEKEDPQKIAELESLIANYDNPSAIIVKHRVQFTDTVEGAHQLYSGNQSIEDLQPGDVFEKKLERSDLDEKQREMLREAFYEILESIHQSEES